MPEKVAISYRGAKYEIGRGKRYYGIWVVGAPASDPIDRWPLTNEGWEQAWARYTTIERPGSITEVEIPRSKFRLPGGQRTRAVSGQGPGPAGRTGGRSLNLAALVRRPARATAAVGLLGLGLLLGLIGLFPGYFGSQSVASQGDLLVPHLLYLATWAVAAALIAVGAARRAETLRMGALLGAGLSAVTFGLFFTDLGQVIAGGTSLGTGMTLSLIGWAACTAGSLLALTVPATHATPGTASPAGAGQAPGLAAGPATAPAVPPTAAGQPVAAPYPGTAPYPAGPYLAGPSFAAPPGASYGPAGTFGPARPRFADAGPLALVVLAAIGAVAAFIPSWDSYTLVSSAAGTSQVVTLGNAFSSPGVIIAGNVVVMIAVIGIAALAALWRPVRHGALLLTGATVALVAQAISALIQISGPATPEQLGFSSAQVSQNGLSISSWGVTPIFWVYCVFVISLVVSIAWMLTAPHPAMPTAPVSAAPAPPEPLQDTDSAATDSDDGDSDDAEDGTDTDSTDSDGDTEDDAESSYA